MEKNVHWNILGGSANYSPKDFENGDATYNAGIGSLNGCGYKDVVRGTVSIYVGKGAYVSGIYAAFMSFMKMMKFTTM